MFAPVPTIQPHFALVNMARSHLQGILASPSFARSRRHRRFLSYLLDASLCRPGTATKEMIIAVEVFGRTPDAYDARLDPIVRIEAGRLRQRLCDYYAGEGADAAIRFDVPRGAYALSVTLRPAIAALTLSGHNAVAGRLNEIHTLRRAANQV